TGVRLGWTIVLTEFLFSNVFSVAKTSTGLSVLVSTMHQTSLKLTDWPAYPQRALSLCVMLLTFTRETPILLWSRLTHWFLMFIEGKLLLMCGSTSQVGDRRNCSARSTPGSGFGSGCEGFLRQLGLVPFVIEAMF
ncbi:hypothetical protein GIB67_035217, partial [Kingdonia uniflora]